MTTNDEVIARVDRARSIIRGNGAQNIEQNMIYLATHELELLETIERQCLTNKEDHLFWKMELCEVIQPRVNDSVRRHEKQNSQLAYLRACTLILHDSRKFLREHPGNPEWASKENVRKAVIRCTNGGLDHAPDNLRAALLVGIVTANATNNEDGHHNELISYISQNLHKVEHCMSWLSPKELSIAFLEAHFNKSVHSTLTGGWL